MAIKPLNAEEPKSKIGLFLPALITFGPVILWMGLQGSIDYSVKDPHAPLTFWLTHGESVIGLIMLMLGLALLKIRQDRIEKRLDELERLRN